MTIPILAPHCGQCHQVRHVGIRPEDAQAVQTMPLDASADSPARRTCGRTKGKCCPPLSHFCVQTLHYLSQACRMKNATCGTTGVAKTCVPSRFTNTCAQQMSKRTNPYHQNTVERLLYHAGLRAQAAKRSPQLGGKHAQADPLRRHLPGMFAKCEWSPHRQNEPTNCNHSHFYQAGLQTSCG